MRITLCYVMVVLTPLLSLNVTLAIPPPIATLGCIMQLRCVETHGTFLGPKAYPSTVGVRPIASPVRRLFHSWIQIILRFRRFPCMRLLPATVPRYDTWIRLQVQSDPAYSPRPRHLPNSPPCTIETHRACAFPLFD